MRIFRWLKGIFGAKDISVQAVRRAVSKAGNSGRARYNLKAYASGKCVATMTLSATFSPEQYESQLAKLLSKIYRRYKWLVRSVEYMPTIH